MRVATPQGIRIAGFISNDTKIEAEEYGFVVALGTSFDNEDYSTLTLANEEIAKVSVASYKKGEYDKYFIDASTSADAAFATFGNAAFDELGFYFTGVLVNVPENAKAYTSKIVCRTYVKISENYMYGEPVAKSVYEVAGAIKAKCEASGIPVPEYVLNAISVVEATNA